MPRKFCVLCLVAFTPLVSTRGGAGNAVGLLDAWIAGRALADPAFRADVRIGGDPVPGGSGRMQAESRLLGPITYRPRTYGELTPLERGALLRDGRFRDFLAAARELADQGKPAGTGSPAAGPKALEAAPPPAEFLRPGDLWLVLSK